MKKNRKFLTQEETCILSADPSLVSNAVLINIAEQWAVEECVKRDVLHSSINGFGINIGKESINDASMLLMHHYINYKTYDLSMGNGYGLVEWMRTEAYEAATHGELITLERDICQFQVKYRSMFWTFGGFTALTRELYEQGDDMFVRNLTLLGIKVRQAEDVIYQHTHKERGVMISIHILNRLSTRALNVFIEQGLMFGQNICQFIMTALSNAKVIERLGAHRFKLSYHGLKFVVTDDGSERKLITVLS